MSNSIPPSALNEVRSLSTIVKILTIAFAFVMIIVCATFGYRTNQLKDVRLQVAQLERNVQTVQDNQRYIESSYMDNARYSESRIETPVKEPNIWADYDFKIIDGMLCAAPADQARNRRGVFYNHECMDIEYFKQEILQGR